MTASEEAGPCCWIQIFIGDNPTNGHLLVTLSDTPTDSVVAVSALSLSTSANRIAFGRAA